MSQFEFSSVSKDNPQPKKAKCFCCGSDQCFKETLNGEDTIMCFSCGFMTSEKYKKSNLEFQSQLTTTAELVRNLMKEDTETKLCWLKKSGFANSLTPREVILDIWTTGTYEKDSNYHATHQAYAQQYYNDYTSNIIITKLEKYGLTEQSTKDKPRPKKYDVSFKATLNNAYPYSMSSVPYSAGQSELVRVSVGFYYEYQTFQFQHPSLS